MNEQNQNCPNCGSEFTELKAGLKCCPACGFQGDKKVSVAKASFIWSPVSFWIALITPATIALTSFLVGHSADSMRNAGVAIGMADLLVGALASIYCGVWIAKRFCKQDHSRVLLGTFAVLGIAAVNFVIIFAGCASNIKFD